MYEIDDFKNLLLMIWNNKYNARQRVHDVNATSLTKPNNVFWFVQLSFNGYSKTAFDHKITSDSCQ